jgi:hypothetical protein
VNGLAFDVVMELIQGLNGNGFTVYFDNFYTSPVLLQELKRHGFLACGTLRENRRGVPMDLKNKKVWSKRARRGDMRWCRVGDIGYCQWMDSRVVTLATTTPHSVSKFGYARRRFKENGQWTRLAIRRPVVVERYNNSWQVWTGLISLLVRTIV